jgi:hypothetical protein
VLPGDPHDTFVDIVNNEAAGVWELVLPNGAYLVSLTCGDPATTATHRVALEGQIVVADVHTIANQYVQLDEIPVTVSDGRLTMTIGGIGGLTHTKVNGIVVSAGASGTVSDAPLLERGAPGLRPNFPNPFHPETRIQFDLPRAGRVELAIYDAAGRQVAVLAQGRLAAGKHERPWRAATRGGRPLPGGVYFCRLEFEGAAQTIKLIVAR